MNYFNQQLLSHFGIIMIAFIGVSLTVSQFVENLAYENKEEELASFGQDILNSHNSLSLMDTVIMNNYKNILEERDINFIVFDANAQPTYPLRTNQIQLGFSEKEWEKLLNGEKVTAQNDKRFEDQPATFVVLPNIEGNYFLGGILLTSPVKGINEMVSQFNRYLIHTILVASVITFLLSWLSSKVHVRRINQLKKATSAVTSGDYSVKVHESKFDEIGELGEDFNKMLARLQESKEEIVSLENRRRQFIADVSHEMRTPLTTIQGVIEGLKNNMIPESEREKGLELVSKESKRLIRLVNENLDYEKIRSNQVELEKEIIELSEAFEIIQEQLDSQAAGTNNEINVEIDGNPVVYADYDRLIQILLNITKNSIQFTENGVITLRGKQRGNRTIIEIEDTGIGMDEKEIENIWRRFYKADISRRSNPFGEFGLGLSIVKKLVQLHNGDITVRSAKGEGTKFTIILPLP